MEKTNEKIEELMEQFNNEFPNGDSFDLAKFMFEKGFEKGHNAGYLMAVLSTPMYL